MAPTPGVVNLFKHVKKSTAIRQAHEFPNRAGVKHRREAGFVTAEFAAALPVVTAVLAAVLWAVSAVGMHIKTVDAAHSGAIAAARGEDAQAAAHGYVPESSAVELVEQGDRVLVTVTASVQPLGSLTPALEVSSSATALLEPGLRPQDGGDWDGD